MIEARRKEEEAKALEEREKAIKEQLARLDEMERMEEFWRVQDRWRLLAFGLRSKQAMLTRLIVLDTANELKRRFRKFLHLYR